MDENAIKSARLKLKDFEKILPEMREKLCPPDISEEEKTEWFRGFDDTRIYPYQDPQSKFYDLGFIAGTDFRDDFFG